jgi:hypothetical protein
MSLGRITIVAHSPYFPIGENLSRCEAKRSLAGGCYGPKARYLVRFAGGGRRDAGIITALRKVRRRASFNRRRQSRSQGRLVEIWFSVRARDRWTDFKTSDCGVIVILSEAKNPRLTSGDP